MGHILKPRLGLRLNHNHPLSQGLVGCWVMNEGSGDKIYNLAQNKHHGSFVNSPWWESDHISFANTTDDYITCGTTPLGITNQLSIEVVASVNVDDKSRLIAKHSSTYGWAVMRSSTSNCLEFAISTTGANWNSGATQNGTFPLNTDMHFVCTYDGFYMRVFINGEESVSNDFPYALNGNVKDSTQDLELGRDSLNGNTHSLNGSLKYARIYNRALTASEIAQLHAEPYAMFEPDTGIWLRYYEAGGGAIIKVVNETLQFSESVNKAMVAKKIINETLQLSESTSKLQDTKKVVNETLQISESVEKKGATKKVVNETLQLSESLLKRGSIKKVINEVLQLSENILKKGRIVKVVNETLQLAENIVRKSGIIRIINEVLNISEGIIKALAVAYGWREVIEGDSPITLVVSGTSTITTEVTGNSTITTEITGNSPLN